MTHFLGTRKSRRVRPGPGRAAVLALVGAATALGVTGTSGALTSHSTKGVVISTLKTAKFGTILVSGKTVYTLTASGSGCTAKCLTFWPEVLLPKGVAKATAGAGVNAAKLGTVRRGSRLQVTYAGKALYWFSKDSGPGKVTGVAKDTWGQWNVVVTVKPHSSGGGTTTTSPGGGGGPTTTSPGGGGIGF